MSTTEILDNLTTLLDNENAVRVISEFVYAEDRELTTLTVITSQGDEYQAVTEILARTPWRLHPLMTTGRPYSIENAHVWILTNDPTPQPEAIEELFNRKDPATWDDVQQRHPSKDADKIKELLTQGYEYSAKWKDQVELTKFRRSPETPTTVGSLQEALENIKAISVDHSDDEEPEPSVEEVDTEE